ncbi:MAG: hypothetical protein AAF322_13450, partial [Pseudomonadota bacterium]
FARRHGLTAFERGRCRRKSVENTLDAAAGTRPAGPGGDDDEVGNWLASLKEIKRHRSGVPISLTLGRAEVDVLAHRR